MKHQLYMYNGGVSIADGNLYLQRKVRRGMYQYKYMSGSRVKGFEGYIFPSPIDEYIPSSYKELLRYTPERRAI